MNETLAKAVKLLEALTSPHEQPAGDDHAWRRCRRCLAQEEVDEPEAQELLKVVLAVIRNGEADVLRMRP